MLNFGLVGEVNQARLQEHIRRCLQGYPFMHQPMWLDLEGKIVTCENTQLMHVSSSQV